MSKIFSKSFYKSKAWLNTRFAYVTERIKIDGGVCEDCKENTGEELHHIIPLTPANINDYDVALNPDNLIWLCKDCHSKRHHELIAERYRYFKDGQRKILTDGCYFDDNGELKRQCVYLIWGAPASGKTTYVKENKKSGDLVVDLDLIKSALSMSDDGSDNLLNIAISVKECIYKEIESGAVDSKNIWVITAAPKKKERQELIQRFNAIPIYVQSDYHECIRRAGADVTRKDKNLQRYVIDRWFENMEL